MKKVGENKRIKKILFVGVFIFCVGHLSYSYEDYYNKVYVVKISKKEIFKVLGANQKQQKKLSSIFDTYQKKAERIEKQMKPFENKKAQIGKIEEKRYIEVAKVLSPEQLSSFIKYINDKKLQFEEKNDKIRNLIDNLNLTNEQKAEILKQDRDFKRAINKLKDERLSETDFTAQYDILKNNRNEKIRELLTEEQKAVIDSY